MPNTQSLRCWFELNGTTYGPAACELTEDVKVSSRGIHAISWDGIFTLASEAQSMPLFGNPNGGEMAVLFEDRRRGRVLFTNIKNGRAGTFKVMDLHFPID